MPPNRADLLIMITFTYHLGGNCGPDIVDLTLTQLRVFVAVAEAGSLRAAARSLGIAQSGVTQQLRKLETNAGGPLFERGHRGARLTSVGERLRIRADVILGECVRTENEMRQLRGELTGQVSLGAAAEAMMRLFPALLASFRERCPRIDVHLTSATSRVLTAWVRDGSLDFALALVSNEADIHDLEATTLFESPVAIIARRGHPLGRAVRAMSRTACPLCSRTRGLNRRVSRPRPKLCSIRCIAWRTAIICRSNPCVSRRIRSSGTTWRLSLSKSRR